MLEYRITVDLAPLAQALNAIGNEIAQRISQGVAATAQVVQERWIESIMRAPGIWAGEKDAYAESVKIRPINPMEIEIFSDYANASAIETGRPPRDLKKMLDTSLKVRLSAKGLRYLIIPFRHNTPGNTAHADAMPADVYAAAKKLPQSSVTGQVKVSRLDVYSTQKREKFLVPQNIYQWGGRLPEGMAPKLKPQHASDPYAGMVRMKTGNVKSAYLTFRVMSEDSPGWIVPAKPGLFIAKNVADEIVPVFDRALSEAIKGALPGG
jgi:hypothetical protein